MDPQNFILSHLQLFVIVVVGREHVKDLLVINLDEAARYCLSREVSFENVMQHARNNTPII